MRISSVVLTLVLLAGIFWWFDGAKLLFPHQTSGAVAAGTEVAAGQGERAAGPDTAPTAGASAQQPRAVPVIVMTSSAQDVTEMLRLRGRTAAKRSVDVAAETAGRVTSEPLRKGAQVDAGQLLCRIDIGTRAAELAEAEAMLAEAAAEAQAAATLSEKGFTAETTRMARIAARVGAAAEVEKVKLDIERLEIRAPFSGILETDTAELGARLAVGDACATIVDLSEINVSAFVSERDVDRLRFDQTVTVHLVNGRIHAGRLSFISRSADEETRTFQVEAVIDNVDGMVRDGMTAEIVIALPAARAHLIAQSALTLDDAGRLGVRLAQHGRAQFVPVTVIRDTAEGLWISGLPDRATIITVGQEFVRDGRPIVPSEAPPRPKPVGGTVGTVAPTPLPARPGEAG
ncbi:MAG: efflux RND transporter periplasmic adaptor subunit [Pseudomonadota bacterium]